MSIVTNVMVVGGDLADWAARDLNAWLDKPVDGEDDQSKYGNLIEIADYAGGRKGFESQLWAGAFNWLDIPAFIAEYRKSLSRFRGPGYHPQLFMKRQDDSGFHLIDPSLEGEYHYRDQAKDRLSPPGMKAAEPRRT